MTCPGATSQPMIQEAAATKIPLCERKRSPIKFALWFDIGQILYYATLQTQPCNLGQHKATKNCAQERVAGNTPSIPRPSKKT